MALASSLRRLPVALTATVLVAAGALGAGVVSTPATADPTPTIGTVSAKLADLSRKNEQLTEAFNKARIAAAAQQKAAESARTAAKAAVARYDASRKALNATILAQYKSIGTGQTSALLTSRNGQDYVDQVTTLNVLGSHRNQVFETARTTKAAAQTADKKAENLLGAARSKVKALTAQRSSLQTEVDKYNALLNTLTAAQRQAVNNKIGGQSVKPANQPISTAPVPAPSKRAAIAVKYALAQQGKPYVFAAAGPDAFDCSGLTEAAWGAAGVSLPHFAETQYNYGTHIDDQSKLEPGDLVFFYQPITHVAMYIGGGMIVHAPTEGDVVKVVPLSTFSSDYVGATRLS